MRKLRKALSVVFAAALSAVMVFALAGCGSGSSGSSSSSGNSGQIDPKSVSSSLTYDHSMQLDYATGFSVDYYQNGYKLLTINKEGSFLIVPEGAEVPSDLDSSIVVLQQPLDNIYLAATATMDMFRAIDSIGNIKMSGAQADDWYIPEAKQAMESGSMVYAGKYNTPDYESMLSLHCDLAVESTMIYHNPDVKEAIEGYGIPVLVDQSSYEEHPLGRAEWVKVYGALLNKEDAATAAFDDQKAKADAVTADDTNTGKTVAFFYITTNGAVNVRKSSDYVPKMIELAGGSYILADAAGDDGNSSSTVKMQMEQFYAAAKDADIVIYNSTIDGEIGTIADLESKSDLLANFKAVQAGTVFCTTQSMYQDSMEIGDFISDLHKIITNPTGVADSDLTYMYRVK